MTKKKVEVMGCAGEAGEMVVSVFEITQTGDKVTVIKDGKEFRVFDSEEEIEYWFDDKEPLKGGLKLHY